MGIEKVKRVLETPVSIAPLITFRILFGAVMLFSTLRFLYLGWVEDHFLSTSVHFHYYGFSWVTMPPDWGVYLLHYAMILGAVGIVLGAFYRWSAALFFLSFTYVELLDLTYYLNHYYFVSIMSMLMIFLPAHRYLSIDVIWNPTIKSNRVGRWAIDVIKFQLAIVYVFAGVAKINYSWLIEAMPLKIWLPANDKLPIIGPLMEMSWMPWIFSWAGMIYDLTIVGWLSWRKSRGLAYVSVLVFHIITGLMFQIGVFPLVMIGATTIFFSERVHRTFVETIASLFNQTKQGTSYSGKRVLALPNILMIFFVLHFIFQLLFPLRFILYPGNLFWTEQGYRFSWRVMLMEKAGTATFYVKSGETGREGIVDNSEFLNAHQEKQMAFQPDMILQYAHYLAEYYEKKGVINPEVRAEIYVTLNGRPSKLFIDPTLNLVEITDGWKHKSWINPYSPE